MTEATAAKAGDTKPGEAKVAEPRAGERKGWFERTSVPGRYVCHLSFAFDGHRYEHNMEVANPAFGFMRLAEWEADVVRLCVARRAA